ncbi:MAG: class I SAM-dependent methyltransferase [Acidimicrobiales bacterium]
MAPTTSSPTGWLSYDSVAATYEAVAVPWFTPLARDLVAALAPSPHEIVLDVGTGTGLIARTITDTEPRARVVGVDPSRAMLAVARATGHVAATAAMAPGLPYRDGTFDAVIANLVISHLPDRHRGLTDLVRVLRKDGRLACSAWAAPAPAAPDNQRPAADRIVDQIRADLGIDPTPPVQAAPWEEWLHDPDHLREALSDAGLAALTIQRHECHHAFSVPQFLAGWGSRDRYLRHTASEQQWQHFVAGARTALHRTFRAAIPVVSHAWIATGTRR